MNQKQTKKLLLTSLRVALGFIFLWSFLDKTFGLGFATNADKAWLAGNSPTAGFLEYGTAGPLAEQFQSLAGVPLVDWLFMFGMLGVGLALILGIGLKVAIVAGSLQMLLIYFAAWPPENNPLVDQHVNYILVLAYFWYVKPGDWYGLGKWWHSLSITQRFSWLK